jgi:hypothetical protein
MLIYKRDNGKFPYPPGPFPVHTKPPTLPFSAYEIPQFTLSLNFRRPGARMPREEANILGKVKYNLQLNPPEDLDRRGR